MSEITEKEVTLEITEKELAQVTDAVKDGLNIQESIDEAVKGATSEAVKEAIEAYKASTEEVIQKDVITKDGEEVDSIQKGLEAGLFSEEIVKEAKEMRLAKAVRALVNGDSSYLKEYNRYSIAAREKAAYANETVDADGGYLVPDPYFDTEVYNNLPKYGVAITDADVRTVFQNAMYATSLDTGLTAYKVAEAAAATSSKATISQKLVQLDKYVIVVPVTDELSADSAIDLWNILSQEVSREYARILDVITFTDSSTGILRTTGVTTKAIASGGAGTTVTWSDFLAAEGKLEDGLDTSAYAWYMRKESYFGLLQTKGTTNDAYLAGSLNTNFVPNMGAVTMPWGTPVKFVRVLPKTSEVGTNAGFAVFANLKDYKLYTKQGLQMEVFNAGIVKDTGGTDYNLITQSGKAMRASWRAVGVLPKGNAPKMVVLGTGTVS